MHHWFHVSRTTQSLIFLKAQLPTFFERSRRPLFLFHKVLHAPLTPLIAMPLSPRQSSNNNKRHASKHRHYVQHDYRDHAQTTAAQASLVPQKKRRGGVAVHFPVRLHEAMLAIEADGYGHVMGWQPHGRCFVIHKPRILEEELLPRYFAQSKFSSFQRQLNLYSFQRLTRGPDAGGYYHELFLRGKPYLAHNIHRQTIKGTKIKAAANPDAEPNFFQMVRLGVDIINTCVFICVIGLPDCVRSILSSVLLSLALCYVRNQSIIKKRNHNPFCHAQLQSQLLHRLK